MLPFETAYYVNSLLSVYKIYAFFNEQKVILAEKGIALNYIPYAPAFRMYFKSPKALTQCISVAVPVDKNMHYDAIRRMRIEIAIIDKNDKQVYDSRLGYDEPRDFSNHDEFLEEICRLSRVNVTTRWLDYRTIFTNPGERQQPPKQSLKERTKEIVSKIFQKKQIRIKLVKVLTI